MKDFIYGLIGLSIAALILVGPFSVPFYLWPKYRVWQQEQSGRAQLAEAEWTKKIKIEEAKADLESAKLKSKAEVERAKGAAESQKIISSTLNEQYLHYLWLQTVEEGANKQTIYIPTEAGLPILESQRLNK